MTHTLTCATRPDELAAVIAETRRLSSARLMAPNQGGYVGPRRRAELTRWHLANFARDAHLIYEAYGW